MSDMGLDGRPVAILTGGAPGSGKTTLAYELGARLELPVVSKDRLRRSTLWALGTDDMATAPWGPGLWYPALEHLLGAGVSLIGDMTLFRGVSEADVASRLAPLAHLVQIHTRCSDPLGRFVARTQADGLRREDLADLVALVTPLCSDLREPVELGCPCIVVDTDDGYRPGIEAIAASIVQNFAPHLSALVRSPHRDRADRSPAHDG
jgi:hypothetical protein